MINRLITILLPIVAIGACSSAWAEAKKEASAIYSPVGKRDPFKPPSESLIRNISAVNAIEQFSLEQLELRAILKGLGKNRAMFEDPVGKTYIVTEGDIIGRERGTVSRILNKEVIVTEKTFNYLGEENLFEKVLSLPVEVDSAAPPPQLDNGGGPRNINSGESSGRYVPPVNTVSKDTPVVTPQIPVPPVTNKDPGSTRVLESVSSVKSVEPVGVVPVTK